MNIKIFILLSLVSLARLHNLEDTWALRTSEIPTLQAIKTPIYFQFARSLSGDGKNIVGYLTITACNILSYNYNVTDSQIFLYFVSKGRTTRTCLNGEITYLRSKLDQVFYFYIMYNSLLLMPANNNSPIKLDIVESNSLPTLNGLWAITDPKSGNKVSNRSVVINGTQMSFCQGAQLINYNLISNVKINITRVKNTANCNDNINILVNASRFAKVNRVDNPHTVTFFDDKVKPVLKMTFQGSFLFNKFVVSQPSSNASTVKTNVTSAGNNATVSNNSLPKSGPNAAVINNQQNISNNSANGTNAKTQANSSTNSNNTKPNSTSTKASNHTDSSNTTVTKNTAAKDSNTSTPTNKTQPPKNISTPAPTTTSPQTTVTTATSTSSQPILISQASQVFGIWYPSPSLLPGSLTVASLSKYQLIINAARLMLSGGCNTIFSAYTFSSGSFKPNNIISTSNSCQNNQDSILRDIIFNPSNTFSSSGSGTSAKMTVNSPKNTPLLLLTQTAPS